MRPINTIVIHCSASPNGVWVSPEQIDAWHAARGFSRGAAAVALYRRNLPHIGYHWIILADGRPQPGRDKSEIGAHVKDHNLKSVGICMVGTDVFFERQWQGLQELLCTLAYSWQDSYPGIARVPYMPAPALAIDLLARMGVKIVGHRDLSPDLDGDGKVEPHEWLKTCPGFDVADWLLHEMVPDTKHVIEAHGALDSANPNERVRLAGSFQ